jgi:hypothetical protein
VPSILWFDTRLWESKNEKRLADADYSFLVFATCSFAVETIPIEVMANWGMEAAE